MEDYKSNIRDAIFASELYYQETELIEICADIIRAWNMWDADIIKTYWKNAFDEKPDFPCDAFITAWIENEDFEANSFNVELLKRIYA